MENIQEKILMQIVYEGFELSETPIEGKKAIGIWVNGVIFFDEAPRKMGYSSAKKYCRNFRKSKPYPSLGTKSDWKMLFKRGRTLGMFNSLCETVGLKPIDFDTPYWFEQNPKNCYLAFGVDRRLWSVSLEIHPLYCVRPVMPYPLDK